MPRDLGHAKRADLTGHFAGEPSEQVSSLTNFLVAAAQLSPPADGVHPGGNGRHETDTEVSGRQTEVPHTRTDTEVAGRLHPGGNGHAHDTVFDSPLPSLDTEPEAMEPEPLLAPEPMLTPEPAGVAPTQAPELGARTEMLRPPVVPAPAPAPLAMPEPESLDSIPDFASPEHDAPLLDEEESAEPVTDKLPPRKPAAALQDLPPPTHSGETGILMMEAEATPEASQLSIEELRADEDTNLQAGFDPSEKITSKVEPRVDTDPRSRDPDAVVRDTVNFYNQTQSLHGTRQAAGNAPQTVAGTVPLAPRPREFEDSPSRRFTPPPPMPSLAAEPEELPGAPSFDSDDLAAEPLPNLNADDEIESADRKDTDRFMEDDRRPPDLPKPMGADKDAPAPRKPAVAGQPAPLDAVAPEKVAAGKDTQKFFVADILRKKDEPGPAAKSAARAVPSSSESTGELQPETVRPPAGESSTDTAFEVGTDQQPTVREPKLVPEPELPEATEVEKDFDTSYYGKSDERIVPEYEGVPEEAKGQAEPGADETGEVPQAPETPERITEKVSKAAEVAALPTPAPARPAASAGRPAVPSSAGRMPAAASAPRIAPAPAAPPAVAAQRARAPRISDEVSRRLAAEREETLKLLDAAEQLATRLRSASEQSRVDLVAISARRRAVPLAEVSLTQPEPPPVDSQPTRILSARDYPLDEKPTAPVPSVIEADAVRPEPPPRSPEPSRSRRERVPTQAIGDIVSAIESKLGQGDEPLSELLQEASRRITRRLEAEEGGNGNGNGHSEPDDEDVDQLVAASGSWRALMGSDEPAEEPELPPQPASSRVVAQSPLAQDLDRMWKELSTRKAAVVSSVEPARISRRLDPGLGWTQEALWKTLAGISLVTFVLGGLFVWVVYRLLS